MGKKVLLVEDEVRIREVVADYFKKDGWEVYETDNGSSAIDWFDAIYPDLVILDIMMPQMDGFAVTKQVRMNSGVPIILLTAKSSDDDKIHGFELGADDYVTKPFSPKVLVARANSLMKRAKEHYLPTGHMISFGEAIVNTKSHQLQLAGQQVELTPKEYELLVFLLQHKNNVLSRETILNHVWGFDFDGDSRVVDTHIKKLRAKLSFESHHIRTVIGTGYKFE
ncbi:DNA-binding response regulator [Niallia circulans]|jgi:two-component system, OmpR family, response regulator|uniref:PhoB family transcriptional regulator n=1 Tax=Niallia circulans TaxID=1397 RepID=A0A0J1INV5_NIACI|nr:response regulator transcription factor [Niallia circulans]KLV27664.1 PhoB family transcriptional regulator [Niallia circulans]MCM2981132.1 response regulator transcription factor [Niallia circulans]MDR4316683.1 response regulator transcription factor [Niallia circulans]MED3840325.1 response regulator transcription factor [Niallia circulans]MED4242013.1 response regulator transcription factor [Niallia circulans]